MLSRVEFSILRCNCDISVDMAKTITSEKWRSARCLGLCASYSLIYTW